MLYLKSKTNSNNIKSLINKYLFAFDDIGASNNIIDDFNKCLKNRTMSDYDIIIKWCNIFLSNNSFTNFKGNSQTVSLLFPMEKVFESYIAKKIKESIWFKEYSIKTQHNKYYLIENPKKFSLRPDIVIEKNGIVTILDTKWKLLNSEEGKKYGLSQSDLYQMYAYAKKYESNNIVLIYPISDYVKNLDKNIEFIYEDDIKLNIYFVDLENIEDSMKKIYEIIAF